jgi:hypothetical protein
LNFERLFQIEAIEHSGDLGGTPRLAFQSGAGVLATPSKRKPRQSGAFVSRRDGTNTRIQTGTLQRSNRGTARSLASMMS